MRPSTRKVLLVSRRRCVAFLVAATAMVALAAAPIPEMTPKRQDVAPFEYVPAKIAFYPPGARTKGDGSWNQMQLPVSPQESRKHMVVPRGFEVELFASEPQIGKVLCMNWDERGRLWISESIDYPNELKPRGRRARPDLDPRRHRP
jgi:uncharacterized protein